jgi:hypothetical protein
VKFDWLRFLHERALGGFVIGRGVPIANQLGRDAVREPARLMSTIGIRVPALELLAAHAEILGTVEADHVERLTPNAEWVRHY